MKPFKVKPDSWHYKILRRAYVEKYGSSNNITAIMPKNFCAYWRAVMFNIAQVVFFFTLFVGLAIAVLTGLSFAIYTDPLGVLVGLAFVATVIGLVLLVKFLVERYEASVQAKLYRAELGIQEPEKQQGLFVTKYKAWKAKICPAIEYEK